MSSRSLEALDVMGLVEPLLVRVEEAARILSLSRSTIYEMLDAGELPSVRRGAARRIPITALRDRVAQQTSREASRGRRVTMADLSMVPSF